MLCHRWMTKFRGSSDFEKPGIDAQLHAENLAVAEFAKATNYLDERA